MNQETLKKRLKAATRSHTVKQFVLDLANGGTVRPNYTSGRGRFTKNMIHSADLKAALRSVGLTWHEGNDAPRYSPTGVWLKLDRHGMALTATIRRHAEAERLNRARREQEERQAAMEARDRYRVLLNADLSDTDTPEAVLRKWKAYGGYHPAPDKVLRAKAALGLSWSEVDLFVKG